MAEFERVPCDCWMKLNYCFCIMENGAQIIRIPSKLNRTESIHKDNE